MEINFTYPSELFKNFMDIRYSDVYTLIRFYEYNAPEIDSLPVNENFILLCFYNNALFTAEEYNKHILFSKQVLEKSIIENIQFVDGHDVFLFTLERKALSHLALNQYQEAERISRQLINIVPGATNYKALLHKVLIKKRPYWVHNTFGLGITSLSLWTGIEIAGLIIFEPFYPKIDQWMFYLQSSILFLSLMAISFALTAHYFFVTFEIKKIKNRGSAKE
jgi:hypothetical protein